MLISVEQATLHYAKSKRTIHRRIDSGMLTLHTHADGQLRLDTDELDAIWPELAFTPPDTSELRRMLPTPQELHALMDAALAARHTWPRLVSRRAS